MTRLILTCVGETDWSRHNRIQGSMDIPLNEKGQRQAKELAEELTDTKIDVVYAGCVSRTMETAEEIARPHKLKVKKLKALNELNQGLWQGLLVDEAKKRYKKQYEVWEDNPIAITPPRGEAIKEAYDRAVTTTQKLIDKHKDEAVCLVLDRILFTLIKTHFNSLDITDIWKGLPKEGIQESLWVE